MFGTAPWIDIILKYLKKWPAVAGSQINHLLMEIYQTMEPIQPVPEDAVRHLWIEVPCGTIEDCGNLDVYIDAGLIDSQEEFEREWLESYSEELKWYEITTTQYMEEKFLFINEELVFQFNDLYETKKEKEAEDEEIIVFLKLILAALKNEIKTVHQVGDETDCYLIEKSDCQKGTKDLNRQIYWDLFGPNAIRMN